MNVVKPPVVTHEGQHAIAHCWWRRGVFCLDWSRHERPSTRGNAVLTDLVVPEAETREAINHPICRLIYNVPVHHRVPNRWAVI